MHGRLPRSTPTRRIGSLPTHAARTVSVARPAATGTASPPRSRAGGTSRRPCSYNDHYAQWVDSPPSPRSGSHRLLAGGFPKTVQHVTATTFSPCRSVHRSKHPLLRPPTDNVEARLGERFPSHPRLACADQGAPRSSPPARIRPVIAPHGPGSNQRKPNPKRPPFGPRAGGLGPIRPRPACASR